MSVEGITWTKPKRGGPQGPALRVGVSEGEPRSGGSCRSVLTSAKGPAGRGRPRRPAWKQAKVTGATRGRPASRYPPAEGHSHASAHADAVTTPAPLKARPTPREARLPSGRRGSRLLETLQGRPAEQPGSQSERTPPATATGATDSQVEQGLGADCSAPGGQVPRLATAAGFAPLPEAFPGEPPASSEDDGLAGGPPFGRGSSTPQPRGGLGRGGASPG